MPRVLRGHSKRYVPGTQQRNLCCDSTTSCWQITCQLEKSTRVVRAETDCRQREHRDVSKKRRTPNTATMDVDLITVHARDREPKISGGGHRISSWGHSTDSSLESVDPVKGTQQTVVISLSIPHKHPRGHCRSHLVLFSAAGQISGAMVSWSRDTASQRSKSKSVSDCETRPRIV